MCLHLACFLTVEGVHAHPGPASAAAHCELCALPHVPLDTHAQPVVPYVLETFVASAPAEARPGSRPITLDRFSRPPPPLQLSWRTS